MSAPIPGEGSSADDVVAWLLGSGHFSCRDEDGRPLGEQAAPEYAGLATNREEHRLFGDSRDASGMPCNIAALRQMQREWPHLLSALSSFEAERPPTVHRIHRRALAGVALAPLLALRAPTVPVSVEAAALHKVTLGFGELLSAVLLEARADADEPLPAGALDDWLSDRPWLIGETQVCAGAMAQIRQVWRSLAETPAATHSVSRSGSPIDSAWRSAWFASALDAFTELAVLAAAAAGAARSALALHGERDDGAACLQLQRAPGVPRLVETLRQTPNGGVAHPTLVYPAAGLPEGVQRFVDRFSAGPLSVSEIDAALVQHARPAAARLLSALGRDAADPLTADAFRRACES